MIRSGVNTQQGKQSGNGHLKISKALHISQNTIAKVIQKFKKDGSATILQRQPGRPRKLTSRQKRLLMRRLKKIAMNGMHGYHPRRMPFLKPMHIKVRLESAEDSFLCSDEIKIPVFGTNGFKSVWRQKGEDFKEKCMVPLSFSLQKKPNIYHI
uniref:Transposase Tc1-like domain-containing protein n=1 Tax=Oryzias latipes TaxID=8090 RepID=A0A3P9JL76_ORYLA